MRIKYLIIVLFVALFLTIGQSITSLININLILVEGNNNDIHVHSDEDVKLNNTEIERCESAKEIISFLEMSSVFIGLTTAIIEFRNSRNNRR